ncbi:MAG TPA: hypothetical protein VM513_19765 [Kofleriaceae bacterium]|nr:hypothetical protein [Kofleriaceae bacterium]
MSRIGEILIERGLVDPRVLERAIAKHRDAGHRLCSFLVANDALTADEAARALGEELGVPAALEKHLDHRDLALADLVPASFARQHQVLPIGRTGAGELIICARDPSPALSEQLAALTKERVVLAVALASRLADLIATAYAAAVPAEYEVDLASGSIVPMPDLTDDITDELEEAPAAAEGLSALTLVELDDHSVSRDLSQSGQIQIGKLTRDRLPTPPAVARTTTTPRPTTPRTTSRTSLAAMAAPPPPSDAIAAGTEPPRPAMTSVERVLDKAMQVAAERWSSVLLLAIRDRLALGHRGHGRHLGTEAVRGVAIPLSAPSLVKAAYDTRALVTQRPEGAGAIEERLARLLSSPRQPAAMPIDVGGTVEFVLVVGDAVADASPQELERLGTEFAAALARLAVT